MQYYDFPDMEGFTGQGMTYDLKVLYICQNQSESIGVSHNDIF